MVERMLFLSFDGFPKTDDVLDLLDVHCKDVIEIGIVDNKTVEFEC